MKLQSKNSHTFDNVEKKKGRLFVHRLKKGQNSKNSMTNITDACNNYLKNHFF